MSTSVLRVGAAQGGGQHRAGGGDVLAFQPLGHPREHRCGALDGLAWSRVPVAVSRSVTRRRSSAAS